MKTNEFFAEMGEGYPFFHRRDKNSLFKGLNSRCQSRLHQIRCKPDPAEQEFFVIIGACRHIIPGRSRGSPICPAASPGPWRS
jgi:hypothetical protein